MDNANITGVLYFSWLGADTAITCIMLCWYASVAECRLECGKKQQGLNVKTYESFSSKMHSCWASLAFLASMLLEERVAFFGGIDGSQHGSNDYGLLASSAQSMFCTRSAFSICRLISSEMG